ncbi:hypothetical protein [Streptomyces sp. NPDC000618]|uniref:hypothetical protein n=1 Tax=Streptomyces sp. NPDC000618 TaxID=3154265 RepID=UPI00332E003A
MFAVPFALVVLSRLAEQHAEFAERRTVRAHSVELFGDFLRNGRALGELREDIALILMQHGFPPVNTWREDHAGVQWPDSVAAVAAWDEYSAQIIAHRQHINDFTDLWATSLLNDLRKRRRQASLGWISVLDQGVLSRAIREFIEPYEDFCRNESEGNIGGPRSDPRWVFQDIHWMWSLLDAVLRSDALILIEDIQRIEQAGLNFIPIRGVANRANLNDHLIAAGLSPRT